MCADLDWASLKQTVLLQSHFAEAVAELLRPDVDNRQQLEAGGLGDYLRYSDVCAMCLRCVGAELRRLAADAADAQEEEEEEEEEHGAAYAQRHRNAQQLLAAVRLPARLSKQDRLLLRKTEPEADQRQHNFLSAKAEFYSPMQKKHMSVNELRKRLGRLWKLFLQCPVPDSGRHCELLLLLADRVLPQLCNATQLADFVMGSFESDESADVAVCAAPCVFHLVYNYSLNYEPLFPRLYELTGRRSLLSRHRARFYKQLDLMLSSTNLSAATVAAFAKKLANSALTAACCHQPMLIGLVLNLLRRHPNCQFLVHKTEAEAEADASPFDPSATLEAAEAAVGGASLWELRCLQRHWDLQVGQLAKKVNRRLSQVEEFFDKQILEREHADVVDSLKAEALKQADALAEAGYASDEDVDPSLSGQRLLCDLDGWL